MGELAELQNRTCANSLVCTVLARVLVVIGQAVIAVAVMVEGGGTRAGVSVFITEVVPFIGCCNLNLCRRCACGQSRAASPLSSAARLQPLLE